MQKITLILIALCLALGGPSRGQIQEQSQPQQHLSTQEEPAEQHLPIWMEEEPSPQELPFPQIDPALMTGVRTVDGWVYFLYPYFPYEYKPAKESYILCRQRPDGSEPVQVSPMRCNYYDLVGDSLYFVSYLYTDITHGQLYVIEPGKEVRLLDEDVLNTWFVDGHLYYDKSIFTTGPGIQGHSLHRMDLDGSNHMIVIYDTQIPGYANGRDAVRFIQDGYAYCGDFRIQLGAPADGTERVEFLNPSTATVDSNGYFYYTTNKLIKARPDGSEQIVLDEGSDITWFCISHIEDGWIYYYDQPAYYYYKIRTDGTQKTAFPRR